MFKYVNLEIPTLKNISGVVGIKNIYSKKYIAYPPEIFSIFVSPVIQNNGLQIRYYFGPTNSINKHFGLMRP